MDTNPDLKLAEEYFKIGKELLEKKDFKGAVMNLEIAVTYNPNMKFPPFFDHASTDIKQYSALIF